LIPASRDLLFKADGSDDSYGVRSDIICWYPWTFKEEEYLYVWM